MQPLFWCQVLNASWFVVFWCPEAEDQVWTAAKTGTSSLTKSLTNKCKICAKYVQNMCKWWQMHLIYILCIVHHVIKRSACVSFVSVALCRRLSVLPLAFHVFSRRLQLFKQRHHLVASQVRATILHVKAPACPVCAGEEINSVREKSLHHRPETQCEMMWKICFWVHYRPWFFWCWCLFHIYKILLFPDVSAYDVIMIVDGWGDLSILENPYIQVGDRWYKMVI